MCASWVRRGRKDDGSIEEVCILREITRQRLQTLREDFRLCLNGRPVGRLVSRGVKTLLPRRRAILSRLEIWVMGFATVPLGQGSTLQDIVSQRGNGVSELKEPLASRFEGPDVVLGQGGLGHDSG